MKHWQLLAIGLLLALCWLLGSLHKEYTDCLIEHRSGVQLLSEREEIRRACKRNLNPFTL